MLKVPTGQEVQAAEEMLPLDGLKLPAVQEVHAAMDALLADGL